MGECAKGAKDAVAGERNLECDANMGRSAERCSPCPGWGHKVLQELASGCRVGRVALHDLTNPQHLSTPAARAREENHPHRNQSYSLPLQSLLSLQAETDIMFTANKKMLTEFSMGSQNR